MASTPVRGTCCCRLLVGCAGVTLRSVATARGLDVRGGSVRAEGDLDFRGSLGIDKEARVGFRAIRLQFDLDTGESPDDVAALLATTERYCVVFQSLANSPQLSVEVADAH